MKRYEEIKKLTTEQGAYYITRCLLDYDCIKTLAVDLSRQKELDADPKAIEQIEFFGLLKKLDTNCNATHAGNDQSMFVLIILAKIKETRLKFSQRSATVL